MSLYKVHTFIKRDLFSTGECFAIKTVVSSPNGFIVVVFVFGKLKLFYTGGGVDWSCLNVGGDILNVSGCDSWKGGGVCWKGGSWKGDGGDGGGKLLLLLLLELKNIGLFFNALSLLCISISTMWWWSIEVYINCENIVLMTGTSLLRKEPVLLSIKLLSYWLKFREIQRVYFQLQVTPYRCMLLQCPFVNWSLQITPKLCSLSQFGLTFSPAIRHCFVPIKFCHVSIGCHWLIIAGHSSIPWSSSGRLFMAYCCCLCH